MQVNIVWLEVWVAPTMASQIGRKATFRLRFVVDTRVNVVYYVNGGNERTLIRYDTHCRWGDPTGHPFFISEIVLTTKQI